MAPQLASHQTAAQRLFLIPSSPIPLNFASWVFSLCYNGGYQAFCRLEAEGNDMLMVTLEPDIADQVEQLASVSQVSRETVVDKAFRLLEA
jgi:hypothetical protein